MCFHRCSQVKYFCFFLPFTSQPVPRGRRPRCRADPRGPARAGPPRHAPVPSGLGRTHRAATRLRFECYPHPRRHMEAFEEHLNAAESATASSLATPPSSKRRDKSKRGRAPAAATPPPSPLPQPPMRSRPNPQPWRLSRCPRLPWRAPLRTRRMSRKPPW